MVTSSLGDAELRTPYSLPVQHWLAKVSRWDVQRWAGIKAESVASWCPGLRSLGTGAFGQLVLTEFS